MWTLTAATVNVTNSVHQFKLKKALYYQGFFIETLILSFQYNIHQ